MSTVICSTGSKNSSIAARKVVGVGSVGTRCWIALLDGGGDDDPLLLQVKEAEASVLEAAPPTVRIREPRSYGSSKGPRLMQATRDLFLGWTREGCRGVRLLLAPASGHEGPADVDAQPLNTFLAYAKLWRDLPAPTTLGRRRRDLRIPRKGSEFARALARFAVLCRPERTRPRRSATSDQSRRRPRETGV